MKGIFSIDNPVWIFIGKLADLCILTCLWAVGSIPVITLGASTAALYTVSWELSENREGYLIRQFFRAYRANLKRGTAAELILALVGVILFTDLRAAFYMNSVWGKIFLWAMIVFSLVFLLTAAFFVPLSVRSDAGLRTLFPAAFVLAFRHLGWTIFMVVCAVCLLGVAVFVMAPLLILVPGLTSYLHSKILNFILKEKPVCYTQS